jgi:hypothetical protein
MLCMWAFQQHNHQMNKNKRNKEAKYIYTRSHHHKAFDESETKRKSLWFLL